MKHHKQIPYYENYTLHFSLSSIGANFTACTPDAIYDQTDRTELSTLGEDEDDPENEDDVDNGL